MTDRILTIALAILGGAFLLCLAGIIYLAGNDKPVPDVLVGTTGTIAGGIVGILVRPVGATDLGERGALRLRTAIVGLLAPVLTVGLLLTPSASAATPQNVDWYGVPTITYRGALLSVAVAGSGSGQVGVVTSSTPAVCTVGDPGQFPATWYPVKIKARGTCVLVGSIPAGGGYDAASSPRSVPVVF